MLPTNKPSKTIAVPEIKILTSLKKKKAKMFINQVLSFLHTLEKMEEKERKKNKN